MRIAHLVTYLSDDGAFGGPTRVAQSQAAALARLGHDVTVFASSPSRKREVHTKDGYELRLFPAMRLWPRGFAFLTAKGLLKEARAWGLEFDVVHVHMARDLVTLPVARAVQKLGQPVIIQPHGMIQNSRHPLAKPLDMFFTRSILASAFRVLALTVDERAALNAISPGASVQLFRNGIQISDWPARKAPRRTVTYLARLHERKRPATFVEIANIVARQIEDVEFEIWGPDEGEGHALRDLIASSPFAGRIKLMGAANPDETDNILARSSVFVLPSVDEVFPMTVLEAFRQGTPTVVTESLGIAEKCREYAAAAVEGTEASDLAQSVVHILTDAEYGRTLAAGAKRYIQTELDISSVARELEGIYAEALA